MSTAEANAIAALMAKVAKEIEKRQRLFTDDEIEVALSQLRADAPVVRVIL